MAEAAECGLREAWPRSGAEAAAGRAVRPPDARWGGLPGPYDAGEGPLPVPAPPSCGTLRRKPGFRVDVTAEDREEGSSRAAESRSSQGRRWHRPRSAWLPLCREALGPVLPFPPLKRVDRHRDLLLTQTRARSPLPPPSPCAGFPSTLELPVSFRGPVPLAVVFIFSDENRMSCSRRSSDPTQRRRPRRSFF